jgi:hypothetical protein
MTVDPAPFIPPTVSSPLLKTLRAFDLQGVFADLK